MKSNIFCTKFKVRDYECDMQNHVNNSVYLNYLEHARHEYLDHIGLNFKKLNEHGIKFVAIRIELDYKKSLVSGDEFFVETKLVKDSKLKYCFEQVIRKNVDHVLDGKTFAVTINSKNKPAIFEEIDSALSML